MTHNMLFRILFCLALWAGGLACNVQPEQPARATGSNNPVSRIVFVDQEQACQCTQSAISASWTAVQSAVGEGGSVQVERVHRDTQSDQAAPYGQLRPMVTVPGIYFLDSSGALVEMLQGEVTEAQVRSALGGQG